MSEPLPKGPEWGTFSLILACYGLWFAALLLLPEISLTVTVLVSAILIAFHSSLTHEALHGHPFRLRWLNEALMAPQLNMAIPYNRFRDTHLAHHRDENLTDPYDDPESNFLDPARWQKMSVWKRRLYRVNNTLLGRILLGPLIGQIGFLAGDLRAAARGDRAVIWGWILHLPGLALVLWVVSLTAMPLWAYAITAYLGLGLVKIRTFLEHRAHDQICARTAVVEDRGLLAFLFLNNNLHVVHHMHPGVPWHALPRLYRDRQSEFKTANGDYTYSCYGQVFRRYFLRGKDPVPHPLWHPGE
ncbi:fatty acid desaturase [Parasedimentitalea marina]|uniref:Fatty acid desaturase n=1 Tax=Parasedimentitalea marina TaxID=2483033 RepID=A0A3T0N070_9RHOB|nr:fatty acid desaturase [Parasedimentitalea marina]AZV77418.1 fatty acid desaturase [Parasedimentitalea marina]